MEQGDVFSIVAHAIDEMIVRHDAEQKSERLEKFVSLVSHDLRTPLASIRMTAEMVRRRAHDPQVCDEMASRIVRSSDRMNKMVEELLDAKALRAGAALSLNRERSDLGEIVENAMDEMVFPKGFVCSRFIERGIEGLWDAPSLRRLVENLMTNAIKYGDLARPVSLKLVRESQNALLLVHNYGNELSANDQAALFHWFCRTRSAEVSRARGWGLGLMLVKGITEAHGGTVGVESGSGNGTAFSVRLPLA